jgi:uncharacterized Tic20 family protein
MSEDRPDRLHQPIPLKFRLLAAGLHGIIVTVLGFFLGFSAWVIISTGKTNSILEAVLIYNFLIGLPSIFVLPTIAWIAWLMTKRVNIFVDLAGRDILNCTLNILILAILFLFLAGMTCSVLVSTQFLQQPAEDNFIAINLISMNFMAIAYCLNSVISAVFALRGSRFQSRLIYPFIRDRQQA